MNEMLDGTISVLQRVSVQGGIALLAVYLLSRLLRRLPADLRCWLWRAAYAKCLVGVFLAVSIAVPVLPRAAQTAQTHSVPTVTEPRRERQPAPVAPELTASTTSTATTPLSSEPATVAAEVAVSPDPGFAAPPVAATGVAAPAASSPWKFYLVLLYALGVVAGAVRLAVAAIQTHRLVRRAVPASYPALPELSQRFGRSTPPHLARSAEVTTPLLAFGTILLPSSSESGDESLILAHELAHLRRNDLLWEGLSLLTQIVLWFHPLVYLARSEERLAREEAADALTLARTAAPPADYARTLLAASLCRSGRVPALAVGAVEGGSRLRQRLEALAAPGLPRRRTFALGTVAVLLAGVTFVPWRAVARQEAATPRTVSEAGAMAGIVLDPSGKNVTQWTGNSGTDIGSRTVSIREADAITRMDIKLQRLIPEGTSRAGNVPYMLPSGVVTDHTGKPVPGAEVSWVTYADDKGKVRATMETDARGGFAFRKPMEISTDTESDQSFPRRNAVDRLIVRASGYGMAMEAARFDDGSNHITLRPARTYTVRFRDTHGAPIAGLPVQADSLGVNWIPAPPSPEGFGYSGVTDASGTFRTPALADNATLRWIFDRSRYAVLARETSGEETEFTLDQGYEVGGRVLAPDGVSAAPGTRLQILAVGYTPAQPMQATATDANGHYRFYGLAQGRYRIDTFPDNSKGRLVVAAPAMVEVPRETVRDFRLPKTAILFGRVTDNEGKPLSFVDVANDRPRPRGPLDGSEIPFVGTTTDANGNYKLRVPAGTNRINVLFEEVRSINILADSRVRLDLAVSRKNLVTVSGRVFDAAGRPVAHVPIRSNNGHYAGNAFTFTDKKGEFRYRRRIKSDVPLRLFVRRGDESAGTTVVPGKEENVTLRLSKGRLGYFTGQVTDQNGTPIPNAVVQLEQGRVQYAADRVSTDAQGRFRIAAEAGAAYGMWFSAPGAGTRALYEHRKSPASADVAPTISVARGQTRDLGQLVLSRGNDTASGILHDPQGQPLPLAYVTLHSGSGSWNGRTDHAGRFAIPNVVAGEICSLSSPGRNYFPHKNWVRRNLTVATDMGEVRLEDAP
jgi:beta-lactamase regulating signal transducer with metallopeptidase domain/protocatechuate 3,4-dioxygenase beta subunit